MIGSRKPSTDELRRSRKPVRTLVRHEVIVASGLAGGVDSAAHGQVIALGGHTVAALGTPVNRVDLKEHADLHGEIVRPHAAAS